MNRIDESHVFCTETYHVPNMAQHWYMKYAIDVDEIRLSILAAFKGSLFKFKVGSGVRICNKLGKYKG